MKEQKIIDYVRSVGFEPKEHGCIVVKRAPETIPLAIAKMFTESNAYRALCLCEHEMVFVPLHDLMGLDKRGSYRVISYDNIRKASVELVDAGMTRRITLLLDDEELVLNAQHESTSALRTSGAWGSWHSNNLPYVIKEITALSHHA